MQAVVIVKSKIQDVGNIVYGPFANEEQATTWAYAECKGLEWHWLPLNRPGSTFLTATVSDMADTIWSRINQGEDCYVTVDDVNWVIPAE